MTSFSNHTACDEHDIDNEAPSFDECRYDDDQYDDDHDDEMESMLKKGGHHRPKFLIRQQDVFDDTPQCCCLRKRHRVIICRCIMIPILIFVSIWIGATTQHIKTMHISDTTSIYQTQHVCAIEYPRQLVEAMASAEQQQQQQNGDEATVAEASESISFESSDSRLEPIVMTTYDNVEDIAQAGDAVLDNATTTTTTTDVNAVNSPDSAAATTSVAHCGECGQCSNPHDIKIYDDTKNTLFQDTLECARLAVSFTGESDVRECLEDRVGFTEGCNECWVENIMCDVQNCLFVCMWQAMFSKVDSNNKHSSNNNDDNRNPQELNACTQCDEKRCGPAFIKCAGANRRRSGIMSEFKRSDDQEVCHLVETEWWQNDVLQEYYGQQIEQEAGDDDDSEN
eukprot:CAMPEP_0119545770 /NCGR_PEP_ID=MMETSP1352-20130426/428_1 /TAXON_ID=265584 /ORGANISM="Stauroneis constricta, Strain CCMP1120" /LENGTH=395 /DNA_ID=CAMNT_0007590369 /DNA_START=216 /DNA_END=1403 /DNA_ORIENTATION=-